MDGLSGTLQQLLGSLLGGNATGQNGNGQGGNGQGKPQGQSTTSNWGKDLFSKNIFESDQDKASNDKLKLALMMGGNGGGGDPSSQQQMLQPVSSATTSMPSASPVAYSQTTGLGNSALASLQGGTSTDFLTLLKRYMGGLSNTGLMG